MVAEAPSAERAWQRAVVARARRGERAAFGEIYAAYAGALYTRVILPRLGDRRAAEDALAETFATALEALPRYEERDAGLWAWLARIATNKALDVHRRYARTGRALANFVAFVGPLAAGEPGPTARLEQESAARRLKEAVEGVLAGLHPRYRRAIELRFFEEQPRDACAAALGVQVATFDVVLLRALRAFRKAWGPANGAPAEED